LRFLAIDLANFDGAKKFWSVKMTEILKWWTWTHKRCSIANKVSRSRYE